MRYLGKFIWEVFAPLPIIYLCLRERERREIEGKRESIIVSIDFDELSICILNDLDLTYSNISQALQARATLVTFEEFFEELFEQLLSYEAQMKLLVPLALLASTLATALVTSPDPSSHHWPNNRGGRNHDRSQQSL